MNSAWNQEWQKPTETETELSYRWQRAWKNLPTVFQGTGLGKHSLVWGEQSVISETAAHKDLQSSPRAVTQTLCLVIAHPTIEPG